jgi:hypothetical protein
MGGVETALARGGLMQIRQSTCRSSDECRSWQRQISAEYELSPTELPVLGQQFAEARRVP